VIAMIRLAAATSLLFLTSPVACSSSSSHSGEKSTPPSTPFMSGGGHFTINAGSAGMFSCPTSPVALVLASSLMVTCSDNGSGLTMTVATLEIAGYHGTGTYTFQGSGSAGKSTLQATINKTFIDAVPGSGPSPATSCTASISGPAVLSEGTEVQGHVHCDNMLAGPAPGTGGTSAPVDVSTDTDFAAFAAL
jgi:hypothetical protein